MRVLVTLVTLLGACDKLGDPSCELLNAECGNFGGDSCGTCSGSEVCGGGGEEYRCGVCATCVAIECGFVQFTGDAIGACGGPQLSCKTCPQGLVCGGDLENPTHTCVTCTPGLWSHQDSGMSFGPNAFAVSRVAFEADGGVHIFVRPGFAYLILTPTSASVVTLPGVTLNLASDSQGRVHAVGLVDSQLAHFLPGDPGAVVDIIDATHAGGDAVLAVDATGTTHVAYIDGVEMVYAALSSDGTVLVDEPVICPSTPAPLSPADARSIAVDDAGGVHAVFSVRDNQAACHAFRSPAGVWSSEESPDFGFRNWRAVVDRTGLVHLAYPVSGQGLFYARWATGGAPQEESIASDANTLSFDLALGADGDAHVIYETVGDLQSHYARRSTGWQSSPAGAELGEVRVGVDETDTVHVVSNGLGDTLAYSVRCPD